MSTVQIKVALSLGQNGDMIDLENMCVLYMDVVHINGKGLL